MQKESKYRSIIKGVTWRIIGTIDTIVVSYFYSGNTTLSVKIGLIEVISKLVFYFLHERLYNDVIKTSMKPIKLGLIKSITWRLVGGIDTFLISFLVLGSFTKGAQIVSTEVFTKIILYYIHELLWSKVPIGTIRGIIKK